MSTNNAKAKTPVVVLREQQSDFGRYMIRLIPAAIASLVVHGALAGLFMVMNISIGAPPPKQEATAENNNVEAEKLPDEKNATFTTVDVNPESREKDVDINYLNDRLAEISVPGSVDPSAAIGIRDGAMDAPPVTIAPPAGFGARGQGGALDSFSMTGNSKDVGEIGGYGPRGLPQDKNFAGRSGATREYALRDGGGTDASEAAVTAGLRWLIRQQTVNGNWSLKSPKVAPKDHGTDNNDIAATAFGLLPLLAAGKTHKPSKDNAYDKQIDNALKYLMRHQDKNGFFGGRMYGHGLAAIAMCEAYGLSQDPALRRSAQMAIDLIVNAQGDAGGWGYGPQKRGGGWDISIAGWQIMALKSGQMAGLNVPLVAVKRSIAGLESCCDKGSEGYGYAGPGASYRMTAVGLLCRQYMENWGPSYPRMSKGIEIIKKHPPTMPDVYYYYYATQVMHHQGGEAWKNWNDGVKDKDGKVITQGMRDTLIKKQDKSTGENNGSWAHQGDQLAGHGGRLMVTALNLLTLEVYYRYLPLYYRDAGYKLDKATQAAF